MTPEEFLREFGGLAETQGGVAQLRNLVRELATSGRLGSSTALPLHTARLADLVTAMQNGLSKRSGTTGRHVPVLRLADIKKGRISNESLRTIRLTSEEEAKYSVVPGDVLVIRVNGSADLVGTFVPCDDGQYAYSDHLIRLRLDPSVLDYRYLCLSGSTATARKHIAEKTLTTAGQKTVNQSGLGSLMLVVPPLPEQKRIVEKVDQLLALCDDLEGAQKKRRETSFVTNKAVLSAVTSASGTKELKESWKRVQDNFEVLYDAPENVQELRQTILQLAVMGKLVRQATPRDAQGIDLPLGWNWSTLGAVTSVVHYGVTLSAVPGPHGPRLLRITDIQNDRVNWSTVPGCDIKSADVPKYKLSNGDLLIARTGGTIGKTYLVEGLNTEAVFASYLIRAVPAGIWPRYLKVYAGSKLYWDQLISGSAGTGQPNVNATTLKALRLPVPPLPEQKRIVEKVDQLMALCDDLDARLQKSRTDGETLMKAVVEHLVAAPGTSSEPMAMVG